MKAVIGRLRDWWSAVRETDLWRAVAPSRRAWWGAALGLVVLALALWLWFAGSLFTSTALLFPLLFSVGTLLLSLLITALTLALVHGLVALPRPLRWSLPGALSLVVLTLVSGVHGVKEPLLLGFALLVVLGATLLGGGLAVLLGEWGAVSRLRRLLALVALLVGGILVGGGGLWLLLPGPRAPPPPDAAALSSAAIPPLPLPDPSQPGEFVVETLTYGSGEDRHRPEYGAGVDLVTAPVNGSRILEGWEGLSGWARTRFWGFDEERLPLNARVWHPQGAGPFPLVLVLHGNHLARDFSDSGYAYLGELLASRGFIVVSVDENFLNSMLSDLNEGLEEENAARGWLLLEHLRLWHAWNEEEGHPFYDRVATERIALVGHSRGGEAIFVAAAFNALNHFPDDALLPFDYGYAIRSLVAIAPVDGQYYPADTPTQLQDINYLALQGSHDADVNAFEAQAQFQRIEFSGTEGLFKSTVYIYRANHGQFNTSWGAYDVGTGPTAAYLNTGVLLPAKEQEQVAAVYLSAFLETTLHDESGYRPLFVDHRHGAPWLPETLYLTRYADAATHYVSTYEEDVEVETTTLPGGAIRVKDLTLWREERVRASDPGDENSAVLLGWSEGAGTGSYSVVLPAVLQREEGYELVFDLADAGLGSAAAPIDLSVGVLDEAGESAYLPLSARAFLQPRIEGQYFKAAFLHAAPLGEPVFQTFVFPLEDFVKVNPAFDPASLRAVRFVFDRTESGSVFLDNVGLRP